MSGQHRADPLGDPIGYYHGAAWEATGQPWQQRPATDPPHLLPAPIPTGPAEVPSLRSAGPVPGALELAHDAGQLEGADQAAALDLEPAWPTVHDQEWEALLERTRANFSLLRRMIL